MKDKPFQTILLVFGSIVTVIILLLMSEEKINDECPTEYERINIFPKEFKALLIKKNKTGGEGLKKPLVTSSLDLNNKGKIIHIPVSRLSYLSEVFDEELWEYVVEGDSIIKDRNSYQVKVLRGTTIKVFDIDCEQFKKELESKNK